MVKQVGAGSYHRVVRQQSCSSSAVVLILVGESVAPGEIQIWHPHEGICVSTNRRGPWPITTNLADLRHRIHHHATAAGLTGTRLEDLLLAANEAAVNVLEHGGGSGTLNVWHDERELTVDVVDTAGRLAPQDVHHRRSSHQAGRGIGLWLMGRLCDEFTIRQGGGRSRVRLRMRLYPGFVAAQ
jgi:serine/threonine-protein kinase RsbW